MTTYPNVIRLDYIPPKELPHHGYRSAHNVADLVGIETDNYTVIEQYGFRVVGRTKRALWRLRCKHCQKIFDKTTQELRNDKVSKCPKCHTRYKVDKRQHDLVGQTFERGTVLRRRETDIDGNACWELQCSCGERYEATTYDLTHRRVKSCGCLQREHQFQRATTPV